MLILDGLQVGNPIPIIVTDGYATYHPQFMSRERADHLLENALSFIPWEEKSVHLFGRKFAVPRLSAWFSDTQCSYTYSGATHRAGPIPDFVSDLKESIEAATNCEFNSVLVNLYRDGADSVGWHADNERELGRHVTIASFSVGTERDFRLKHRQLEAEKLSLRVEHGSLLMMYPPTQDHWLHELPKRKLVNQPRVNFSFRNVRRRH